MKTERKKKLDNFDIHKFHKEFEESVKRIIPNGGSDGRLNVELLIEQSS